MLAFFVYFSNSSHAKIFKQTRVFNEAFVMSKAKKLQDKSTDGSLRMSRKEAKSILDVNLKRTRSPKNESAVLTVGKDRLMLK